MPEATPQQATIANPTSTPPAVQSADTVGAQSSSVPSGTGGAGTSPSPGISTPTGAASSLTAASGAAAPEAGGFDYGELFKKHNLEQLAQQFGDPQAALGHVLSNYQQALRAQQFAQYGEQVMPHFDKFQSWMRQQQEEEAKKQAEKQKWFNLPEFDPRWRQMVAQNESGELVPAHGAPPDVVMRLRQHADARRELEDKLYSDPEGTLGPLVQHIAEQKAREIVAQHMGQYQDTDFSRNFVRENSNWLFQQGAGGGPVVSPLTGQPVLSPMGERFRGYVDNAARMGIQNLQMQRDYAISMLQRDQLLQQVSQPGGFPPNSPVPQQVPPMQQALTPQAVGEALKTQFLAGATKPNVSGAVPANGGAQSGKKMRLEERLRGSFQANGHSLSTPITPEQ